MDLDQKKQLEVLQDKVNMWLDCIGKRTLNSQDKQLAYSYFLRPQILYPLGCTPIRRQELKRLFRPVLDQLLHSLGLNRHFPLAMVHAGSDWLGIGVDDLYTMQGVAQLQLMLGHVNKGDRTGELIRIERDWLELALGLGKCPLKEPHIVNYKHAPMTWVTLICAFLYRNGSSVELRHDRVVPIQRANNQYLMQLAIDGNFNLNLIQQCRLYLKVATMADVCNVSGDRLEEGIFSRVVRPSTLSWPRQEQPSRRAWTEWRRFLTSFLSTYGKTAGLLLQRTYRLGCWSSTHQRWDWRGNESTVTGPDGSRYWRRGGGLSPMDPQMQLVEQKTRPLLVWRRGPNNLMVRDEGYTKRQQDSVVNAYCRLQGDKLPMATAPQFSDREGDIVIATDGTLREGRGGAVHMINSVRTPGTMKSVMLVDGTRLTSYQTELMGILGALLAL